jgi:hypothetical protein
MKICYYVLLASPGFVTGCTGAWYWYQASKVSIIPTRDDLAAPSRPLDPGLIAELQKNPLPPEYGAWLASVGAATKASRLNKTAAIWTAASVALNALAGLLSGCLPG